MNKNEAIEEAANIGRSYFYDFLDQRTDEEILDQIKENTQRTRLTGLKYVEKRRDALAIVLTKCSDRELDNLLPNFGHIPDEVGGSSSILEACI